MALCMYGLGTASIVSIRFHVEVYAVYSHIKTHSDAYLSGDFTIFHLFIVAG